MKKKITVIEQIYDDWMCRTDRSFSGEEKFLLDSLEKVLEEVEKWTCGTGEPFTILEQLKEDIQKVRNKNV